MHKNNENNTLKKLLKNSFDVIVIFLLTKHSFQLFYFPDSLIRTQFLLLNKIPKS